MSTLSHLRCRRSRDERPVRAIEQALSLAVVGNANLFILQPRQARPVVLASSKH
jgi:hypothetical protein